MADTSIFGLTATTTLNDADVLPIVDVSDTAQSANGSTRKFTLATFKTYIYNSPTFSGITTGDGASVQTATAIPAFAIDVTKGRQTKTISANETFTFSATPTAGTWFGPVEITNSSGGSVTATIPSSINNNTGSAITSVTVAATSSVSLIWFYNGTAYRVYGVPSGGSTVTLADITDMSANARTFNEAANYAAMRTALGVAIGTDVQAYSANLDEYAGVNPTAAGLALLDDADAAAQRTTLSAAARSQTEAMFCGYIGTVADKDYRVVLKAAHAGTITETTTRSESGTCTATFKINTTNLGGTANSVSSTEQSQAHASANAFSAGDDIVLTVSSNSSCVGLSFSIQYTRTLS
jgi:hypothetical protein